MQDLLGLGDSKRIKAVAGLAGGIGHQGAACGILTGGSLALALVSAQSEEDQAAITARGSTLVNQYVNRFTRISGSALCREITRTDFGIDNEVRRYMLVGARNCVKLASKAAETLVDLIAGADKPGLQKFDELNQKFAQKDFHCAYSVLSHIAEILDNGQLLGPTLLIPLNGGIGYSGSTCAALLGGCMAIGLARGGDASEGGMSAAFKRILLTLLLGTSAYSKLNLSPANDALLRCGELFSWFQNSYGTHLCRGLTRIDFDIETGVDHYFADGIERCKTIGAETAEKAAELAR
jgi:hypothetical protein